jgi:hypothetical protein
MLKLASRAGLAVALANLKQRIRRLAVRGILAAIGIVVLVMALCWLLIALHLWLSAKVGPIGSAAIIGGVLLIIAAVLLFLASRTGRTPAPAPAQAADPLGETIARAAQSVAAGPSPLTSPVFLASLAALSAGIFLGRYRRPPD